MKFTFAPRHIAVEGVAEIAIEELFTGSWTVTIASHFATLPLKSVTERVTVLFPKFPQLNVSREALIDEMPQLSVEPLSICDATIEALPVLSKVMLMFLHNAVGSVVSEMVNN